MNQHMGLNDRLGNADETSMATTATTTRGVQNGTRDDGRGRVLAAAFDKAERQPALQEGRDQALEHVNRGAPPHEVASVVESDAGQGVTSPCDRAVSALPAGAGRPPASRRGQGLQADRRGARSVREHRPQPPAQRLREARRTGPCTGGPHGDRAGLDLAPSPSGSIRVRGSDIFRRRLINKAASAIPIESMATSTSVPVLPLTKVW
jgi:hypothetical protein